MAYQIDEALKEFVESGVAVLVGTGDASGRPHVTYGWGPRVGADGTTIDLFLDTLRSLETIANVGANGRIAMTVAHPVSYRSVQFKGITCGSGAANDEDNAWVRRHRDAFIVSTSLVGDPPESIGNLWLDDVVRVSFTVERAFNQTPGPQAGTPL